MMGLFLFFSVMLDYTILWRLPEPWHVVSITLPFLAYTAVTRRVVEGVLLALLPLTLLLAFPFPGRTMFLLGWAAAIVLCGVVYRFVFTQLAFPAVVTCASILSLVPRLPEVVTGFFDGGDYFAWSMLAGRMGVALVWNALWLSLLAYRYYHREAYQREVFLQKGL